MKILLLLPVLFSVLDAGKKALVTSSTSESTISNTKNNVSTLTGYLPEFTRSLRTRAPITQGSISAKNSMKSKLMKLPTLSTTDIYTDPTTIEETTMECTTTETTTNSIMPTTEYTSTETTFEKETSETTTNTIVSTTDYTTSTSFDSVTSETSTMDPTVASTKIMLLNLTDKKTAEFASKGESYRVTTSIPTRVKLQTVEGYTKSEQREFTKLKYDKSSLIVKSSDQNELFHKSHTEAPLHEKENFPTHIKTGVGQNISTSTEKYKTEHAKAKVGAETMSVVEHQAPTQEASVLTTETSINSSHIHIEIDIDIGSQSANDSASNSTRKTAQKKMVAGILLAVLVSISAFCALVFVLSPSKGGTSHQDRLLLISAKDRRPRRYYDASLYATH